MYRVHTVLLLFFGSLTGIAQDIVPDKFIDNTRGQPARENLTRALELVEKHLATDAKKTAVDLGAGAGNETLYLLKRGWEVTAVDTNPYAIQTIKERAREVNKGALDVRLESMQETKLEPNSVDLINASLSLPFVPREDIRAVWSKSIDALRTGGVFTGHFFGPEHAWREREDMTFLSVNEIFDDFIKDYPLELVYLLNEKEEVKLGVGGTAFFHTITVIVQKTSGKP